MKSEFDFFRKSIRLGGMAALNSGIMGLGAIWISREIGPISRGELTKILLIYAAMQILTESGVLGSATYFSSKYPRYQSEILRLVHKSMIRKLLFFCPILILVVIHFELFSTGQIWLIITMLIVGNLFSGPSHVLQSANIELWRKSQSTQALAFVAIFLICVNFNITTNLAFILIVLPGVVSSIIARNILRRIPERQIESGQFSSVQFNLDFSKYSRTSFLWILASETFARLELILASAVLTNHELGNFSLLLSWLMISTPFAAAIGNIVFPTIARDFDANNFRQRHLYVYLRNTVLTSTLLSTVLLVLVPILLNRIMDGVYEGYSEYVLPMGLLVVLKQLSTVLSEIVRGLNLNILYTYNLVVIILLIFVACWIAKPSNPISVLVMLILGHVANLLVGLFIVMRVIQRGNVK
jgi:O-antigen/teichoic acid export membrane protein